ncbi:Predicted PurR-regulated permease PerM [Roseomonas rosea]|uniref:Predicted PurR-regulated permease PerM n=1 Tax=Muricoccus roseus TaxID=198092 RepID=A0A1M6P6K7_9PROT|nr:AI-2E family transporter [Roseomonas rosea]SHK03555.1 Predicted PurR-regulated permease PerM [Roseomonas rosea]
MAPPDRRLSPAAAPVHAAAVPLASHVGGPVAGAAVLVSAAVVVAGLYFGRDVLVPLVLAVLLAFVLAPVARLLQRLRLGKGVAVLVTVLAAFALIGAIFAALGVQAAELAAELPRYAATLRTKLGALSGLGELLRQGEGLLGSIGIGGPLETPPAAEAPVVVAAPARSDTAMLNVVGSVLGPILHPLATAGLVVIFTILTLLYREDLRDRAIRLAGARDLHRTMTAMNDAAGRLSRLFLAQVALNAGYAVLISGLLWAVGLPSPLLWGILAGLMRFVPFIGTPIAVAPPLVLALAVDPGWSLAITVLAVFILGGAVMGQVLEPLLFGKRTGLSPLSVVLAASFWAFLWGPIGLLISTPLTVGLVVLGRHVPRFEFFDVMLGDRPPLQPQESFYQRALEGDADGLVEQAREILAEPGTGLAAYGDMVALQGLVLAQTDWSREALEADRLEVIRTQVGVLLDDLSDFGDAPAADAALPTAWAAEGAVVCIAGRGPMDELTARLAALVLHRAGLGARAETSAALETANLGRLDPGLVRLVCLSVLEEGNSVAGLRYFLRRIARQLPEAKVIVGLWDAPPESAMLAALREEGPAEAIVTSLGEAAALGEAFAARG